MKRHAFGGSYTLNFSSDFLSCGCSSVSNLPICTSETHDRTVWGTRLMSTYRPPAFMMHNALESNYDGLGTAAAERLRVDGPERGQPRPSCGRRDAVVGMARHAREMGFTAVLHARPCARTCTVHPIGVGLPVRRRPLRVAVDACHGRAADICPVLRVPGGRADRPQHLDREHPEYANWSPATGPRYPRT